MLNKNSLSALYLKKQILKISFYLSGNDDDGEVASFIKLTIFKSAAVIKLCENKAAVAVAPPTSKFTLIYISRIY